MTEPKLEHRADYIKRIKWEGYQKSSGKLCNNKMVVVLCHYLQQDFSFLVFYLCKNLLYWKGMLWNLNSVFFVYLFPLSNTSFTSVVNELFSVSQDSLYLAA